MVQKGPKTSKDIGDIPLNVHVEWTIARICVPSPTQPMSRARTITPTILVQAMSLVQPMISSREIVSQTTPDQPSQKLGMPKKCTSSRTPTIYGWLTKMGRYFRLMNYPINVWMDVLHMSQILRNLGCIRTFKISNKKYCQPWENWEAFK